MSTPSKQSEGTRGGVLFALAAYFWWVGSVFYFKAVEQVPALEVLAHRVVWSVPLLLGVMAWRRRLPELRAVFKNRKAMKALACTTVLIAANWFAFIWAVGHEKVLETSLGYFINPLVNVLLGLVFLRERLTKAQVVSVLLAAIGVVLMGVRLGQLPLVSLVLPFSFGFYGLIRKRISVGGVMGLTVETLLLAPLAVAYLAYGFSQGTQAFLNRGLSLDFLLLAAGPMTALPLIFYVAGVRRLRYATIGLMQYIVPSLTFLLAVFLYDEPFGRVQLLSFVLIWAALLLYSIDTLRNKAQ